MSKTLKTTFRSYSTIEKAVADCRELAALANSMSFSVVDFITGPLKQRFRGRLSIEILADDDLLEGPAEVAISKNKSDLTLRVKKCIWIAASEGDAEARRILAHEIGHIWLHQDERFRFSEVATDEHNFIPNEELVEWQAHIFADNFLMPILSISTFNKLSELIDYCELFHPIPDDVVQRQFLIANDKKRYHFKPMYDGRICPKCGGEHVQSLLSYQKCDDCGHTCY